MFTAGLIVGNDAVRVQAWIHPMQQVTEDVDVYKRQGLMFTIINYRKATRCPMPMDGCYEQGANI